MENDNLILSKDGKTLIRVKDDSITHVVIPEGVTTIGEHAFGGCKSLQSIDIPDSVTTIGDWAFWFCESLQYIHVAENNSNYTSIDGVLFSKDKSTIIQIPLGNKEFKIPDGVTAIEDRVLLFCKSLQRINIPNSVARIGDRAFFWCKSLQNIHVAENNPNYSSIDGVLFSKDKRTIIQMPLGKEIEEFTIPNGVTTIGNRAFSGCESLQRINIPNSVTRIGDSAFDECKSLQIIHVAENNPNYSSMNGVLFSKDKRTIIRMPLGKEIEEFKIPNGVTVIGSSAFCGCQSLQSINIPDSVTTIGSSAFSCCKHLKIIHIAESNPNYSSIDGVLFSKDKRTIIQMPLGKEIEEFTIPNGVKTIENCAFRGCESLERINIPNSVTRIGDSAFFWCKSLQNIHVAENNPNYSSIDGVLFSKDKSIIIRMPLEKEIEEFTIPNGVTSIGISAFCDCKLLQSIDIPDSVTTIGNSAFRGCSSLQSINIPNSVTTIGDWAFFWCKSLQRISIPNSVTTIGERAFDNCKSLKIIHVSEGNPNYTSIDGVVCSEGLTHETVAGQLACMDGVIICPGFGSRGIEGKIVAAEYCRTTDKPTLGICLGMQMMVVEYARNVLGYKDANSSETNPQTPYPVIDLMEEQKSVTQMGGTMRLGAYACQLALHSKAHIAYGCQHITERHRHRYEFNNVFRQDFEKAGMTCSGINPDNGLVEIVEVPACRWYVGVQFHPEYTGTVLHPNPLFVSFINHIIH